MMKKSISILLIASLGFVFSSCGNKEKEEVTTMEKSKADSVLVAQQQFITENPPASYHSTNEQGFYPEFFVSEKKRPFGTYGLISVPSGTRGVYKGNKGKLPELFVGVEFNGKIYDREGSIIELLGEPQRHFLFTIAKPKGEYTHEKMEFLVKENQGTYVFEFPSGVQSWPMSNYEEFKLCSDYDNWRILHIRGLLLTKNNKVIPVREDGMLAEPRFKRSWE